MLVLLFDYSRGFALPLVIGCFVYNVTSMTLKYPYRVADNQFIRKLNSYNEMLLVDYLLFG